MFSAATRLVSLLTYRKTRRCPAQLPPMMTKLSRKAKYSSQSARRLCRSCPLVVWSLAPGAWRASASSVIAIATTASEKVTTRSEALTSTSGSSVPLAAAMRAWVASAPSAEPIAT